MGVIKCLQRWWRPNTLGVRKPGYRPQDHASRTRSVPPEVREFCALVARILKRAMASGDRYGADSVSRGLFHREDQAL